MTASERAHRNAHITPDKLFVVKVQVATTDTMPCMVYDRDRSLEVLTYPELVTPTTASVEHEGVQAMQNIIRGRGVMGRKAYFNAYVTNQTKLRILVSDMVVPPSW